MTTETKVTTEPKEKHQSKYRHVYGEPAKPEHQFLDLKNPFCSGEGNYLKANTRFFCCSKSWWWWPIVHSSIGYSWSISSKCTNIECT